MPLTDFSAAEAIAFRKGNKNGNWGNRGGVNRVEPVAAPSFDTPFRLVPGEAIFTIGSCFARNVEKALSERGFKIPARDVFHRPDFAGHDPSIINNYAAPSIYNELAWAFGEQPFDPQLNILEVAPGKFADLHFSPAMRPDAWDTALHRREAITQSYKEAANCRVVIITLGLSEVWFDTKTGMYLNVTPRPAMIRAHPDRFRLHTLSYEESFRYLDAALQILRKHGREDLKVLLTVSPVPLAATHRPMDVIVANAYSKSVLRAAAEEAVCRYPWVTYFPSYESFTLSDRKRAFVEDLVHTNDDLVAFNVSRMIDAYTDGGDTIESIRAAMATESETVAVQKAREVSSRLEGAFFSEFGFWSERSLDFAVEHAKRLLAENRTEEAEAVLNRFESSEDLGFLTVYGECALLSGDPELAMLRLSRAPDRGVKSATLWDKMIAAAVALGDPDTVIMVAAKTTASMPGRASHAYFQAARFFRDRGEREKALGFYRAALDARPTNLLQIELADLLLVMGRVAEAAAVIETLAPVSRAEEVAAERLRVLTSAQ